MEWVKVFDYNIMGKRIIIKDSMIMISKGEEKPEWPYVKVNSGKYIIEFLYENDLIMSTRIYKEGSNFTLGNKIGELEIDHSKAAFCDYDLLLKEVNKDYDEYIEWAENKCEEKVWENQKGVVNFKNHKMIFFQSGHGDGVYPVFELLDNANAVGMFCKFEELNCFSKDPILTKNKPFWEIERIVYDDAHDSLSTNQIASLREYIRTIFKKKEFDQVVELEYLIVKYLNKIDHKMLAYSKKRLK